VAGVVLLFIQVISDPLAERNPYPYLLKLAKSLSTLFLYCYAISHSLDAGVCDPTVLF